MEDKCILDPQRDCIGKAEAAKLEGRIKALEDWKEDSKKFHNSFYDWQRQQIAREAKLDEKLGNMDSNIQKLLLKQESCDAKPGKFLDSIKNNITWALIAAVLGFLLGQIGL